MIGTFSQRQPSGLTVVVEMFLSICVFYESTEDFRSSCCLLKKQFQFVVQIMHYKRNKIHLKTFPIHYTIWIHARVVDVAVNFYVTVTMVTGDFDGYRENRKKLWIVYVR